MESKTECRTEGQATRPGPGGTCPSQEERKGGKGKRPKQTSGYIRGAVPEKQNNEGGEKTVHRRSVHTTLKFARYIAMTPGDKGGGIHALGSREKKWRKARRFTAIERILPLERSRKALVKGKRTEPEEKNSQRPYRTGRMCGSLKRISRCLKQVDLGGKRKRQTCKGSASREVQCRGTPKNKGKVEGGVVERSVAQRLSKKTETILTKEKDKAKIQLFLGLQLKGFNRVT